MNPLPVVLRQRPSCASGPRVEGRGWPAEPNLAICLTDAPAVVELKQEFRRLDTLEEDLKRLRDEAAASPAVKADCWHQLEIVRARKAEIARGIFGAHGL